jgi:hypothetical protein
MNLPALPFWMLQRQLKAEPIGETSLRLLAPNLPAHELTLEAIGPSWRSAIYRVGANGDKHLVAERVFDVADRERAWQNAYELFRQEVIV